MSGIVAIVPARGGSRRIPRKNIKLFAGLPMIGHALRTASESRIFDRIIVSTDDAEIAEVARRFGAETPFVRPQALADDFAGTDAVIQHALEWLENDGIVPEYFCCIYATAPFIEAADLRQGFELVSRTRATTVFPVTTFDYTIFRALRVGPDGRAAMIWPENFSKRSQDFETAYHDAGQFYWGYVPKYLRERRLFATDSIALPIERNRVQDIDTPEDWAVAEQIFLHRHAAGVGNIRAQ